MDRLELALRRYLQIVPKAVGPLNVPVRKIRVWLAEDVCRVLEDFTARPTFREYASWPIRVLRIGAATPERALVERVDDQLQLCGKALTKLTALKIVSKKLDELFPPKIEIVAETAEISGRGIKRTATKTAPVDHLKVELSQVRAIAGRDWKDLVEVNDYFEPQQEWVDAGNGQRVQRGEWVVSVNPELLPIGNFVVRCLLKRIEMRFEILRSARKKCLTVFRHIPPKYPKQRTAVEASWDELVKSIIEIQQALRTGQEMRLRDSCVALTQTYAAFHPKPNLDWLGLRPGIIEQGRSTLAARLTQWQNAQMLDRIATSLGDLRYLFPEGSTLSAVEEAVASGGLVIEERTQVVHWETQQIAERFWPVPWKFLLALARCARSQSAAGLSDVYGNKVVSDSAISTTFGRLKHALPPTLWKLVKPGKEPRTYRLHLEPHRIHIFP